MSLFDNIGKAIGHVSTIVAHEAFNDLGVVGKTIENVAPEVGIDILGVLNLAQNPGEFANVVITSLSSDFTGKDLAKTLHHAGEHAIEDPTFVITLATEIIVVVLPEALPILKSFGTLKSVECESGKTYPAEDIENIQIFPHSHVNGFPKAKLNFEK